MNQNIIINIQINILLLLMESLLCPIADHKYPVDAICMNKKCTAEQRILCIQCFKQFHAKCQLQYFARQEFLSELTIIKNSIQMSQKVKVQKEEFKVLKTQIMNQLNQLEDNINKIFDEESYKIQALKRIDLILSSQLTKEAWMDGYDLLTNGNNFIPFDQDALNSQIQGLRSSLELINDIANQSIKKNYNWKYITKDKPFTIEVDRGLCYKESIACSNDGRYLGIDNDYSLELWDLQNGVNLGSLIGHNDYITSIEFTNCGNYIISGSLDKMIKIWDIKTMKQIGKDLLGHTKEILSVQYSLDEKHILSGSKDQTIRIWDVQSRKEIEDKRIKHEQPLNSQSPIQFSPNREQVLIGDTNHLIIIYDFKTKKPFGNPLTGHTSDVFGAKFSPDSKLIVSGGQDKTIRIWSVETQTQIGILQGHQSQVYPVMFSPDMNYVVSGSYDQTVRIWNWRTGTQVGNNITGHNGEVRCAKFSPNGRYILSGDYDGHFQIIQAVY